MATTAIPFTAPTTILLSIFFFLFSTTTVSSLQFQVGWAPPPADDNNATASDSYYDQWATHNRFHVGDSLNFVYGSNESDSVLLVNSTAYSNCNASDPILQLNHSSGGNATFQFDRPGLFYFISGKAGSCIAGQKLEVRVMAEREKDEEPHHHGAPSPAPSGGNNGDLVWDWPPAVNSTVKMTIASYFMTALAGVLVILYLLM